MRRGKKRKGIEAHRVEHPTPSQAADVLTGDKEQNGKQKRIKKKNRGVSPNPTTMDHSVTYDVQGSHGERILFTGNMYIYLFIYYTSTSSWHCHEMSDSRRSVNLKGMKKDIFHFMLLSCWLGQRWVSTLPGLHKVVTSHNYGIL